MELRTDGGKKGHIEMGKFPERAMRGNGEIVVDSYAGSAVRKKVGGNIPTIGGN